MADSRTNTESAHKVLLRIRGLDKRFGGVHALKGVDLTVRQGEIHGVVGENGAGKSTLIKIVSGAERADRGEIRFLDETLQVLTPLEAMTLGIGTVYQDLSLVPMRTVAQNIFCRHEPVDRFGFIDKAKMNEEAGQLLRQIGVDTSPRQLVRDLGVGDRQIVEIAKVLSRKPKLLILDEPTSALCKTEIDRLFALLSRLRQLGMTIIFISHKLDEVLQIADAITVLRDGSVTGHMRSAETNIDDIIELMVGRKLEALYPEKAFETGEPILSVKGFALRGSFDDVSFDLREGEVLGVFGLVGSGRTELARAICGSSGRDSGDLYLRGRKLDVSSPSEAIRSGLVYMTEDRLGDGLFLRLSVAENIIASNLEKVANAGFLSRARIREVVQEMIRLLRIVTPGLSTQVQQLSGGNQQKVLLAKTLCAEPRVLIADEPTRGVDVGAKAEVHAWLRRLASEGMGIMMISSELPEILGMSDRIMVMYGGRVRAIVDADGASEESLLSYCYGAPAEGSPGRQRVTSANTYGWGPDS